MTDDLKKLAEAATPGLRVVDDRGLLYVRTSPLERIGIAVMMTGNEADARFLEAASADAVLSLYREREAALAQRDAAEAALAKRDEEVARLRGALAEYHAALKRRENGVAAGFRLIDTIESILIKEPTNAE